MAGIVVQHLLFLAAVLGLYALLVVVVAAVSYRLLFHPKTKTLEYARQRGLEKGEFDAEFLDKWIDFEVASPLGYDVRGSFLPSCSGSGSSSGSAKAPTLLLVHGIRWNRYSMFKYARVFAREGWNVACMDLPGHGESRAPARLWPSFGFHEKRDIGAVLAFLRARFPESSCFGLLGQSLGAACVLQYLDIAGGEEASPRVHFAIADSSFSTLNEAVRWRIRQDGFPAFIGAPAAFLADLMAGAFRGFRFGRVSPSDSVSRADTPVLFIHGLDDHYVPFRMSAVMYNRRVKAGKRASGLLLVPGARHVGGFAADPEAWTAAAFSFVRRFVPYPIDKEASNM